MAHEEVDEQYTIIRTWLEFSVGLPQQSVDSIFQCFILNGYETMDMIASISRKSTLTELGIVNSSHRKKILSEILVLRLQPHTKPSSDHNASSTHAAVSNTHRSSHQESIQDVLLALYSAVQRDDALNEQRFKLGGTKIKNVQLLIFGYLKSVESQHKLFKLIPFEVGILVYQFYPKWIPFESREPNYNEVIWTLSEQNTVLQGTGNAGCDAYYVYADMTAHPEGMTKGVHSWSVRHINSCDCFKSIGVVDRLHSVSKDYARWDTSQSGAYSYFDGYQKWNKGETITVELDCNEWRVRYFCDGKLFQEKTLSRASSNGFYFALLACARSKSHFETVQDPTISALIQNANTYKY